MEEEFEFSGTTEDWKHGLSMGHISQICSIKLTQKSGKSKQEYNRQKYKNFNIDEDE